MTQAEHNQEASSASTTSTGFPPSSAVFGPQETMHPNFIASRTVGTSLQLNVLHKAWQLTKQELNTTQRDLEDTSVKLQRTQQYLQENKNVIEDVDSEDHAEKVMQYAIAESAAKTLPFKLQQLALKMHSTQGIIMGMETAMGIFLNIDVGSAPGRTRLHILLDFLGG